MHATIIFSVFEMEVCASDLLSILPIVSWVYTAGIVGKQQILALYAMKPKQESALMFLSRPMFSVALRSIKKLQVIVFLFLCANDRVSFCGL